jgi:integrase
MASITKRGEYQYQAQVRRTGYPTKSKTFETRKDAEKWARDIETQMDKSLYKDRRQIEQTTLGQALERYRQTVTSTKRGRVAEENRIKRLCAHPIAMRTLASLDASDFCSYRDERTRQGMSNSTVRIELAILSNLYKIARAEWCLPLEPVFATVTRPKPGEGRDRRFFGKEETQLFEAIHRPRGVRSAIWLDACVRLAIETGMRAGEILSLHWNQVDFSSGMIRLKLTKNGCKRSVPLSTEVLRVLTQLPRDISGKLIPTFYDTSGLDRAFKRACKAAEIDDFHFHDLRHEAASRFAPHMTAPVLAKIMGWKTIQMAMRYYKPNDDDLRNAVRNVEEATAVARARVPASSSMPNAVNGDTPPITKADRKTSAGNQPAMVRLRDTSGPISLDRGNLRVVS